MNQMHKESLPYVENALPNRSGLEVEIFGMEGIPEDLVQQVMAWLAERGYGEVTEVESAQEHLLFALPPELRRDLRARGIPES